MLKEILDSIDESLENNFNDVFKSLQQGATEDELEFFREKFFTGKEIPEGLITLYKWHNGQVRFHSLNQDDNRTFLPINEVIDAWKFLNNPMEEIREPWSKSWIPILYNGAGDYVVYETKGSDKGKLIEYWHDDEDRDIVYDSLDEWAEEVLASSIV